MDVLGDPIKPFSSLDDSGGKNFDLADYAKEHPYMQTGKTTCATFRITKNKSYMVGVVVEYFGTGVYFRNEAEDRVDVSVPAVCEAAMCQFAKNYATNVVLLKPQRLVQQVKDDLQAALKAYESLQP